MKKMIIKKKIHISGVMLKSKNATKETLLKAHTWTFWSRVHHANHYDVTSAIYPAS